MKRGRLKWEGGVRVRWVRRGERVLEWVHAKVEGRGCLQLTGNLFLPFSLNKGCDWLHCVRTDLLLLGNKARRKKKG